VDRLPQRKNLRLRAFDYRWPGPYFVTICTQHFECRFGQIRDYEMHANDAGEMILETWQSVASKFPVLTLDAHVLMPNHFHGIVMSGNQDIEANPSLGDVVQWFKTMTTNRYIQGVKERGWPPFDRRLWHRNYHDHVIRNDKDMDRIRTYIENNPAVWMQDRFHVP